MFNLIINTMKKHLLLMMTLLFASIGLATAQTLTVTGTVVSEKDGQPVAGAYVLVNGTTIGTMTNDKGEFGIAAVPADAKEIIVTFLGMSTAKAPVQAAPLLITMEEDVNYLDDVVVVAYGTVRREAATGSVSSVKNEQLAQVPATSVDKMLSGKMAGVTITSGSGQPGSTSTIRVRGISSINAGNEPLWVVDGIPVMSYDFRQLSNAGVGGGSSSTFLNPNDIESITVLKDAAAASVYGSRAANGVILVTTKSGKAGKARFTARAKFGAQQLINDRNWRALTGEELIDYYRTAAINAGHDPYDPADEYYTPDTLLENGTTNWYKELTRVGTVQEYEINASGGTNKSSYYASVSYHSNEGVFYGVDYDRFSARINSDFQLLKSLKTGAKFNLSYSDSNSGQMGDLYYSNPQFAMFRILPWTPFKNEDGSYNVNVSENANTNPAAIAEYDVYNDKDYRLQGSVYLEWKPIEQLTFKTTNALEFVYVDSKQYWAPETNEGTATLWKYWSKDTRFTTSNTVTYNDMFGNHSVRVLAGQEAMVDTYDYLGGKSPNVNPLIPFPNTSAAAEDQVYYGLTDESMVSVFGVADYNYDNKYFFQGSVRADGSSLFGAANRWGVFWSVGGSWNITKENWMAPTRNWLSLAKIRASYGVNGNNNIAAYRAYGIYATATYGSYVGMVPSRPANPNLSWEKNNTGNVGLDLGFFDDRLTASVDLYERVTEDMLLDKRVPYTTGFGSNFMNIGSIRNRGLELQMEGLLVNHKGFQWTAGFNIAFNRSKVLDLADSEYLGVVDSRAGNNDGTPIRIVKDKSLYTYYLRDWYGVNPSNGDPLWYAEDGSLTSDHSKARYVYEGSPEPKATGGFNTSLSWKGLTLSAFFEFVYGNQVLMASQFDLDAADMKTNTTTASLGYWEKPGDTGVLPKPVAGAPKAPYKNSTRFLQDGSYTRIKDVTLSYALPERVTNAIKMQGLRVYVSALNPYTFHNVKGVMDPELGPLGYSIGASHTMVKSLVGGIEVSF